MGFLLPATGCSFSILSLPPTLPPPSSFSFFNLFFLVLVDHLCGIASFCIYSFCVLFSLICYLSFVSSPFPVQVDPLSRLVPSILSLYYPFLSLPYFFTKAQHFLRTGVALTLFKVLSMVHSFGDNHIRFFFI